MTIDLGCQTLVTALLVKPSKSAHWNDQWTAAMRATISKDGETFVDLAAKHDMPDVRPVTVLRYVPTFRVEPFGPKKYKVGRYLHVHLPENDGGTDWPVINYVDVEAESHMCNHAKPCPEGFEKLRDKCYRFFGETMSVTYAMDTCTRHGARLPEPRDMTQFRLLSEKYDDRFFWLGLMMSVDNGQFYYRSDREKAEYVRWASGHPVAGNKCTTKANGNDIETVACSSSRAVVCELHPDEPQGKPTMVCPNHESLFPIGDKCYSVDKTDLRSHADAQTYCASAALGWGSKLWEPRTNEEYAEVHKALMDINEYVHSSR